MIGSHCLFRRSWTAILMISSHVVRVGGRVSRESHILFASTSFCTKFKICWAIGLSTGKMPSTNPDPYFHPRPLNDPPRHLWVFRHSDNYALVYAWISHATKHQITLLSGNFLVIKASQLATLVNEMTVALKLLNRVIIGFLCFPYEITLTTSWLHKDKI